jgi:hypothetical protein
MFNVQVFQHIFTDFNDCSNLKISNGSSGLPLPPKGDKGRLA